MQNVYDILDQLNINYEKHEHPAVFTVEEAIKHARGDGVHSKNLFLRNKKGNKYFLVISQASKKINLNNLENKLNEKHLSFASTDRVMQYFGVTAGAVSPFNLVNDTNKDVNVIIDSDLLKSPKQGFHPNVNTETIVISTEDFKKFLEWTGNKISYLDL